MRLSLPESLDPEALCYSLLYGRGVYRWDGDVLPDPLADIDAARAAGPLLENVRTGERFVARRLVCKPQALGMVRQQVLAPPRQGVVTWPSDLVTLSTGCLEVASLFVDNQYTEAPVAAAERGGDWALLFPYDESIQAVRLQTQLKRMEEPNWKSQELRQLAVRVALAIERLNRCGYVYHDMHLSRFLVRQGGDVFLDFSPLLYGFSTLSSADASELCAPGEGEYPVEFMEPGYVQGKVSHLDFNTQNYALCALLFYLLFGRYAYDGRLLVGESDDSALHHYDKFRNYHQMPVFIFDEADTRNGLGLFAEDDDVIALWQEAPQQLRDLFQRTLAEANALRTTGLINPAPRTWLRVFTDLGWLDGMDDVKREMA